MAKPAIEVTLDPLPRRAWRTVERARVAEHVGPGAPELCGIIDGLAGELCLPLGHYLGDASLTGRFLRLVGHGLNLVTSEAQPNLVDKSLKFVRGNGDGFGAEAKPPIELKLDGLNFAVRVFFDLDHLTELLAIRALHGLPAQCCQTLVCLLKIVDDCLAGLRM
jgi:hypothetical protein